MDAGLQALGIGALLVTSLLLRNVAARHVTPEMVPSCLQARLRLRNRIAPAMLAAAAALVLAGLAILGASQIATGL
jgi:hypothetical protein